MQIDLQDEGALAQLVQLQEMTHQSVADILHQAIEVYYQQVQTRSKTPLEIAQATGFIGCIQAEPDLSQNYKAIVRSLVEERHDHR